MRKHNGFTLVELVVVVMILGILAAVAVPRLVNTSSAATNNGLRHTLATVRDAIERYAAEHGGELPVEGTENEAGFKTALEPYLRGNFPTCPVATQADSVAVVNGPLPDVPTGGTGWAYSSTTGEFIVNSGEGVKGEEATGTTYNDL